MAKKPAQLSDNLLVNRPRKGDAKAQTEAEASRVGEGSPAPKSVPRRPRRRSKNTEQLNLRVSPETLERFTELAYERDRKFGDMLADLLDAFEGKK